MTPGSIRYTDATAACRPTMQKSVGTKGDYYDRYLIRLEDMRQSTENITQAINEIPNG